MTEGIQLFNAYIGVYHYIGTIKVTLRELPVRCKVFFSNASTIVCLGHNFASTVPSHFVDSKCYEEVVPFREDLSLAVKAAFI